MSATDSAEERTDGTGPLLKRRGSDRAEGMERTDTWSKHVFASQTLPVGLGHECACCEPKSRFPSSCPFHAFNFFIRSA